MAFLILVSACVAGSGDGDQTPVACDAECPAGTRTTSFEAVVAGDGVLVAGSACEISCEPILQCIAPNVPTAARHDDGSTAYVCEALEGFSSIPADSEVSFEFAALWAPELAEVPEE